ncbi:YvrJ family protein [Fictibacillus sp. WQ 8-8]|uniref:YvrJ family protein n=1 Tax=unclassified Fictibacillus TaxID=2644029 RepID=UPI00210CE4C8|nr:MULTISPECIES: YvrJ family protein [unclassified Fictibacillus]MCQ6264970.1 YvrJ family protein [Fictibacillus sp. WQ 8-8]MED2974776.1 YvrJ family protein [Fictibacillus sp. B-59209]
MNTANDWLGLVNLLGNVGFPVLLAGYLMLQFEKRIQSLEAVIKDLRDELVDKEELEKKMEQYGQRLKEKEELKKSDVS